MAILTALLIYIFTGLVLGSRYDDCFRKPDVSYFVKHLAGHRTLTQY